MTSVNSQIGLLILSLAAFAIGCGSREGLPTSYGHRRGVVASKSVNGLAVLSDMFEAEGWETASWRRLSPKLREADVIFWAPNTFNPPKEEQIEWLESWMDNGYDRTLVLVGRGYDAAPEYWQRVVPNAPPEDEAWMDEERKQAEYVWKSDLKEVSTAKECRWYKIESAKQDKRVKAFRAGSKWAKGVDAKKANVVLSTKLTPPKELPREDISKLLESADNELIAYRVDGRGSRVIVINNGSFLLNLALVNKENRKLAGRLIDECSDMGTGKVMFLEETPGRLQIYEQEPANNQRSGFTMLTIWPLGFLLLHLMILGAVVCFVAFPIYGRPKRLKNLGVSDFGKHIQALGRLIAATQNRNYALERLKYYEDHVRRETRENN